MGGKRKKEKKKNETRTSCSIYCAANPARRSVNRFSYRKFYTIYYEIISRTAWQSETRATRIVWHVPFPENIVEKRAKLFFMDFPYLLVALREFGARRNEKL